MKRFVSVLVLLCAVFVFCACGSKDSEEIADETPLVTESADADTDEPKEEDIEDEEEDGVPSLLTNENISEENANMRPLAIMIPNDDYGALPQYGLSYAGVVYEVPVEAPYTRFMAIFDRDVYEDIAPIGPVRSCRLYYCHYALEFDAIYAHYGESSYAKSFLNSGQIDHLDGMNSAVESIVYYRDTSRSAPDNAFTNGQKIIAGIESLGYRQEYEEGYEGHYTFADKENKLKDGQEAVNVSTGYQLSKPWFEYNEDDGLYYRYEYGTAHMDALSGKQIAVKNIIIQATGYSVLESHSTYNLYTTSGGEGYYITNGRAIHINWSKASESAPCVYTDDNGNEIELNTGHTWVCVVLSDKLGNVTLN